MFQGTQYLTVNQSIYIKVCMDKGLAPVVPCVVYSFGINNEWSFDDHFVDYGCQVFAFDPSINVTLDMPPSIHFYQLGLGAEDTDSDQVSGWKLRTLSSLYDTLKLEHGNVPIDYLKLDVEQAEWGAIGQILRSGMFDNVKQLGIEIHFMNRVPLSTEYTRICLNIIKSMEDYGLVRFNSRVNLVSEGILFGRSQYLAFELAWYNQKYRPKFRQID